MKVHHFLLALSCLAITFMAGSTATDTPAEKTAVTMIVMDPLAAALSCDCVKGYAQRDYEKLAKHLEQHIGRPVQVHFAESLTAALERKSQGKADLIIGKHSVVSTQAAQKQLKLEPIASLTGKDGLTTQTGLIVVTAKDTAISAGDLKGYHIIFGSTDCDEKYKAALHLLKDNEVALPPPEKHETCASCSDGALAIIEMHKQGKKAAAVISSYAQPLLEGCGTIQKGDLRVVGTTEPVPFITAFINTGLPTSDREAIARGLFKIGENADLCKAMETKNGFIAYVEAKKK